MKEGIINHTKAIKEAEYKHLSYLKYLTYIILHSYIGTADYLTPGM